MHVVVATELRDEEHEQDQDDEHADPKAAHNRRVQSA